MSIEPAAAIAKIDAGPALNLGRGAEEHITDWYLPEKGFKDGFIYPGPAALADHPRLFDQADRLLREAMAKTESGYEEFVVRDQSRTYRGHRIYTIEGYVYALRRLPDTIPPLDKLGVPPGITGVLLHPWLKSGGLVIVCGETGQGKSTTCAAVVKERMLTHGSFCLTVEDPPEMPLHGVHGKGRCLQTEVKSGDFASAMRGAMRCYPTVRGSLLYVGETRDSETAAEVLKIATNGHLVLTTLHAQDLMAAIKRFISLAAEKMGSSEVNSLFGTVLRLALHQKLDEVKVAATPGAPAPSGPPRRKLNVTFLLSDGTTSPVANSIRRGQIENIANDIDQQERTLKHQGINSLLSMWKV